MAARPATGRLAGTAEHVAQGEALCGLCASRGEARKMVQSGAVLIGEEKVTDIEQRIEAAQIGEGGLLLRKGKKSYCKLVLG